MVKADMTAPLRLHIEQLHLKPSVISSCLNSNEIAPQWHVPLYVFILVFLAIIFNIFNMLSEAAPVPLPEKIVVYLQIPTCKINRSV